MMTGVRNLDYSNVEGIYVLQCIGEGWCIVCWYPEGLNMTRDCIMYASIPQVRLGSEMVNCAPVY